MNFRQGTAVGAFLLAAWTGHAVGFRITIAPLPLDRTAQVVSFPLPDTPAASWLLRDASGHAVPLQADGTNGTFLLPALEAGTAATFALEPAATAVAPADVVATTVTPEQLAISIGGAPVLAYQRDPERLPRPDIAPIFKRAGYLHPITSPGGHVITGDYPADHLHHHGVWSPWTHTRFQGRTPDFWNMGQGSGTVLAQGIDVVWSGPVHAGFTARHDMVDLSAPEPVVALHETWTTIVYSVPARDFPVRVFDLVITQTCATPDPLELPEYRYGGLGFRGRDEWLGSDSMQILTSEGETDRVKAHGTRMRWCYLGGVIDGTPTGVAILDHPSNLRAPQPVRIHPNEPFFCYAPPALGDFAIIPGKPYVAHYRFVVFDGPPDAALLDRCWNGFAHDAVVTVERIP